MTMAGQDLKLQAHWWATRPLGRHQWKLWTNSETLRVRVDDGTDFSAELADVDHLDLHDGLILTRLSLSAAGQAICLEGLTPAQADEARRFLRPAIAHAGRLNTLVGAVEIVGDRIAHFLAAQRYIAESETRALI